MYVVYTQLIVSSVFLQDCDSHQQQYCSVMLDNIMNIPSDHAGVMWVTQDNQNVITDMNIVHRQCYQSFIFIYTKRIMWSLVILY